MARSTVAVRFTGDVANLKRATGDAEGALADFGSKAGAILKRGLAAAGVAGAAALAKGFSDTIGQEASTDKAAASLGLSEEESERLGSTAGELYADAYGESFQQVSDTAADQ